MQHYFYGHILDETSPRVYNASRSALRLREGAHCLQG